MEKRRWVDICFRFGRHGIQYRTLIHNIIVSRQADSSLADAWNNVKLYFELEQPSVCSDWRLNSRFPTAPSANRHSFSIKVLSISSQQVLIGSPRTWALDIDCSIRTNDSPLLSAHMEVSLFSQCCPTNSPTHYFPYRSIEQRLMDNRHLL